MHNPPVFGESAFRRRNLFQRISRRFICESGVPEILAPTTAPGPLRVHTSPLIRAWPIYASLHRPTPGSSRGQLQRRTPGVLTVSILVQPHRFGRSPLASHRDSY